MASSYEADTYAWALDQAQRIRSGQPIDVQNVAEEIEDLGKRQRSFLIHNLEVLLMHLLKWDFQPDKRTRSWGYTIKEHQNRVNRHMRENPSLQAALPELLSESYENARLKAAVETGLDLDVFPTNCPYSWQQITGA